MNGSLRSLVGWTIGSIATLSVAYALLPTPASSQALPIKIGLVYSLTGPLAGVGEDTRDGFKLYLDEIGYKAAGREIQVIVEDDQADPGVGITKVRKLVERDGVHLLAGIISSAVAYALRDYVDARKIPLIVNGSAGATDLTQEKGSPYIFRTSFTNEQFNLPFGPYACEKLGYRRAVIMASNFVTGHEQARAFERFYVAKGCRVVEKIFVPLGTADYAPYLAKVRPGDTDAVWAMFFGADAIRFVKQYKEYGLKDRVPLIGSAGLGFEPLLPVMGEAALGMTIPTWYHPDLDSRENRAFVQSFRQRYRKEAGSVVSAAYIAARGIVEALNATGGQVENTTQFVDALKRVRFVSPQGLFKFDEKQNVVFDALYCVRMEMREGKPYPKIVDTVARNVDQFWKPK